MRVLSANAMLSSWPGLTRPSRASDESVVDVVPLGVLGENKIDFPSARPMLHVSLTLDCRANVVVALSPDQKFEAVLPGETIRYTFPMLPNTAGKIAGDSNIKRTVWSVGHNIDPSALHNAILGSRKHRNGRSSDGRVKPGHDVYTTPCLERTS